MPPNGTESGSSRQLTAAVLSQEKRSFIRPVSLALPAGGVCIVGFTWLRPGVHQPDPPGLIHDDPRLLPPWRGSSFVWGASFFAAPRDVAPKQSPVRATSTGTQRQTGGPTAPGSASASAFASSGSAFGHRRRGVVRERRCHRRCGRPAGDPDSDAKSQAVADGRRGRGG